MFSNVEQIKIISSFNKENKKYGKIQNRVYHGFMFRIKGDAKYVFNDKTILVKEGEIIFLPKHSFYEYSTVGEGVFLYTSINFEADIVNAKPTVYRLEDYPNKNFILHHFSKTWKFANTAEKLNCISIFYNFISHLCRVESLKNKDKFNVIEPAIEYLKNKIFDPKLKIDKLHTLCGISSTYFRKIFKNVYDTSPQQFVLSNRLSHAKHIIESGDYDSLYEVAYLVGFSDPLYFSKAYKNYFGCSPSKTID